MNSTHAGLVLAGIFTAWSHYRPQTPQTLSGASRYQCGYLGSVTVTSRVAS